MTTPNLHRSREQYIEAIARGPGSAGEMRAYEAYAKALEAHIVQQVQPHSLDAPLPARGHALSIAYAQAPSATWPGGKVEFATLVRVLDERGRVLARRILEPEQAPEAAARELLARVWLTLELQSALEEGLKHAKRGKR